MRRLQHITLSLFISLAFLASTLAVCNAHLSATEHPDCTHCITASSSRHEDEAPAHPPAGPHHCPEHACTHLHAPFIVDTGAAPPPLEMFRFFPVPPTLYGRDSSLNILRPPRA